VVGDTHDGEELEDDAPEDADVKRLKLNLKAEAQSTASHFGFKRLVPGGFDLISLGSTCTAPPMSGAFSPRGRRTKLQNFQMSSRISKKLLTNASSAVQEGH
jgi:hypothetical protein